MKKIITLCLFVFALMLGTESVMAQNKIEINTQANEKTEKLRKTVKFSTDQRDQMYQAFKTYFTRKARLTKSNNTTKEATLKIEEALNKDIEKILTEEQFARYQELQVAY